jgi:hypothetical protein
MQTHILRDNFMKKTKNAKNKSSHLTSDDNLTGSAVNLGYFYKNALMKNFQNFLEDS